MRVLPICLNLNRFRILIVGGGKVAAQKLRVILLCGGKAVVIAKEADDSIKKLFREKKISLFLREFKDSDLTKYNIVYTCTDSPSLNKRISQLAQKRKILCNVASNSKFSNFISPAVYKNGHIIVSVSTSGKNPSQAVRIRDSLKKILSKR